MCRYRTRKIATLLDAPLLAAREDPLIDAEGTQSPLVLIARVSQLPSDRQGCGMQTVDAKRGETEGMPCIVFDDFELPNRLISLSAARLFICRRPCHVRLRKCCILEQALFGPRPPGCSPANQSGTTKGYWMLPRTSRDFPPAQRTQRVKRIRPGVNRRRIRLI